MKKIILTILLAIFGISLVSCDNSKDVDDIAN